MLSQPFSTEKLETIQTFLKMLDGDRPEIGTRIDASVAALIFKIDFLDIKCEINSKHEPRNSITLIDGIG